MSSTLTANLVAIPVQPEVRAQFIALAEAAGVTVNDVVRDAFDAYLGRPHRLTRNWRRRALKEDE